MSDYLSQPPHGGSTLHRKSPVPQVGLPDPKSVLPVRVRPAGIIVPGGERVGKASPADLPFRDSEIIPRRSFEGPVAPGRISFSRRNERPARRLWDAVDWGYVRFALAVVATFVVVLHIAIGRAR